MVLLTTLFLFCAAANAASPDTRSVDRPLERLEHKLVDARNSGKISAADFDRLRVGLVNVRTMREEAVADGNLSGAERETIRKAIREVEVELAEAKFGSHRTLEGSVQADPEEPDLPALTGNPVPRPERTAAGSAL